MTKVLVDTSPDLREQLLDAAVERLDGIVLTHEHADHTHGIDDIRPLVIHNHRRIDVYMDEATSRSMTLRFGYIFSPTGGHLYPALCNEHRVSHGRAFTVDGPGGALEVLPFHLRHGDIDALGLRFGSVAYTPDVVDIPEGSSAFLADLDLWIIDALRRTPHPTHFSLSQALAWIGRLKPRRAVITNMHTDLDYETLAAELPPHIVPAYDGMQLSADSGD